MSSPQKKGNSNSRMTDSVLSLFMGRNKNTGKKALNISRKVSYSDYFERASPKPVLQAQNKIFLRIIKRRNMILNNALDQIGVVINSLYFRVICFTYTILIRSGG